MFQKESLNENTRNLLWNQILNLKNEYSTSFEGVLCYIWGHYLKKRMDEIPQNYRRINSDFLKKMFFDSEFNVVFDILELLAEKFSYTSFLYRCNEIFEKENCAYRFVNEKIAEIVSNDEIQEIEKAVNLGSTNVEKHIKKAIEHFSDRQNPDYRNSIKESISAVEAICRNITKESTLDRALNKFKSNGVIINSQLKQGLEKIYYYTNDKNGIRHALMEDDFIKKCDARFMLVLCSAFVNYINEKFSNN